MRQARNVMVVTLVATALCAAPLSAAPALHHPLACAARALTRRLVVALRRTQTALWLRRRGLRSAANSAPRRLPLGRPLRLHNAQACPFLDRLPPPALA